MNPKNSFLLALVNYLPGFIILAFGVYALQASVLMLQNHRDYIEKYRGFGMDIMGLQQQLTEIELTYLDFVRDKSPKKFEAFENVITALKKDHQRIIDKNSKTSFGKSDDFAILTFMKGKLQKITDIIADYKNNKVDEKIIFDLEDDEGIHAKIERLVAESSILQHNFYKKMDESLLSDDHAFLKYKLYWAVIAITLSGFVLVVLNNYKMQQIQKATAEKKDTLDMLQSRQTAIDSSRDGIMLIDHQGLLTYVNEALLAIYGINRKNAPDLIGKSWYSLFDEEGVLKIKYEIQPVLIRQGYWRGKFTFKYLEDLVYTELSLTKLDNGGMIGSTLDITDEQRAREEKSKLEDQFFQAQKMEAIGRLSGGIAHDFNNILAAMNGYAEFLIEDLEEGSAQKKFANNILLAGRQARELVDRMLAFSRRSDSAVQTIDLLDSVQESALMLQASIPKSIELITDIQIPDAVIRGNATQIAQTIMNLCVNAKDAMEDDHGQLILQVKLVNSDEVKLDWVKQDDFPNPQDSAPIRIDEITPEHTRLVLGKIKKKENYVVLRVQDTGSGMGRIIMEHIFEPFFTTKSVDKGTGLGLATVHGVVTGHQGMLILDSVLGKGTTFDLYFPYIGNAEHLVNVSSLNVDRSSEQIDDDTTSRNTMILLVEDQDNVRDMMIHMLKRIGHDVECVNDGLDALNVIRENPDAFDLIITDHNMPRMTGLELVEQVHVDYPDLPFILFSGYSQKEIQDIQENHPAIKAVLRKPVAREVLAQRINLILKRSGSKDAA